MGRSKGATGEVFLEGLGRVLHDDPVTGISSVTPEPSSVCSARKPPPPSLSLTLERVQLTLGLIYYDLGLEALASDFVLFGTAHCCEDFSPCREIGPWDCPCGQVQGQKRNTAVPVTRRRISG